MGAMVDGKWLMTQSSVAYPDYMKREEKSARRGFPPAGLPLLTLLPLALQDYFRQHKFGLQGKGFGCSMI